MDQQESGFNRAEMLKRIQASLREGLDIDGVSPQLRDDVLAAVASLQQEIEALEKKFQTNKALG